MSIGILRLFFVLMLGSIGALLPLIGGRFEAAGLGGVEIGAMMALFPLGRLIATPITAAIADRWKLAGLIIRVCCVVGGVSGVLLARTESVPVIALAMFGLALRSPVGAIVDAMVVQELRRLGRPASEYGRVRLFGSVGFLGAVVAAGWMERFGVSAHWLSDVLFIGAAVVAFAFPLRGEGGPAPVLPAIRELAREPFLLPLLITGALQALTLSVYDTFLSVHTEVLGMPSIVVGACVALGVGCETVLMAWGARWLGRLGPARCLLLATATGIPRWALTAVATDPALLVATQVLHGIGFGAFWLAGVQRMAQAAPPHVAASAQSLWASATYGLGALAGAALAGEARDHLGTGGIFWVLAGVSVVATGTATWLVRVDAGRGGEAGPRLDSTGL